MKEGARPRPRNSASTLKSYAGKFDGDNESQVAAIEACIADGAKGILLTASDTARRSSTRSRRRATPAFWSSRSTRRSTRSTPPMRPSPPTTFKAGELIGQWAKATLGDAAANAKIAMLDLAIPASRPSTCCATRASCRASASTSGPEQDRATRIDARIVGHEVTDGNEEGGRKAMESLPRQGPRHQRRLHDQRTCGGRRL